MALSSRSPCLFAQVRRRALSSSSSSLSAARARPQRARYDAIVVGGGHNGLVAAAYLARGGRRALVLERRALVGGAAVTEELVPGYKFSRASYVYALFRPQIVRDLDLHRHGLVLLPRAPSSFTPAPAAGARSLLLGGGAAADAREIAKFSARDAEAYPRYNALLERYAAALLPLLDAAPPDPAMLATLPGSAAAPSMALWLDNWRDAGLVASRFGMLGAELPGFFEFLAAPATKILDRFFESDELKATLATDAIVGALIAPSTPGSAYVLLHHVMCGTWSNVKGGMGALSDAVCAAAREAGAEVVTDAPVRRILLAADGSAGGGAGGGHRVEGVELEDGSVIRAERVLSSAAPSLTFGTLLGEAAAAAALPPDFRRQIGTLNVQSGSVKINLALSRLPSFLCAPNGGADASAPMPHHRGTIHFETHSAQIEAAFRDAQGGVPSRRPVVEMTLPSVLDDSIAPPGKHVCLLFCQYARYDAYDGRGWDAPGARERFAASVFAVIEEYAPGFTASIVGRPDVLTPLDLERVFGLPGGNISHASMSLDQLFFNRPAPGFSRYRAPVKGLYLCGAGAHPGGGVMGAPGRNAAREALADMEAQR